MINRRFGITLLLIFVAAPLLMGATSYITEQRIMVFDKLQNAYRYCVKGESCGQPITVTKTTDYTIPTTVKSGTVFLANGDVDFTLPAPASTMAGAVLIFVNIADTPMVVKTATADTLCTDGDVAADSVSFATTSHQIGGRCLLWCDGTSWWAFNQSGCTMTVTS